MKPVKTNGMIHVGFIVNDMEKTATAFAEFLGVPVPDMKWKDVVVQSMEDPEKKLTIKQRIVFFSVSESVKIELIEPDHQPSVWRQWLDKNENGGIHHLAFNVSDMGETVKTLEENGMPLISAGDFNGGSYSYNDALDSLKTVIETVKINK